MLCCVCDHVGENSTVLFVLSFVHAQSCPALQPCGLYQASLCMLFPRQEYWSGLPFASLGDLPTQGLSPHLLPWQMDSLSLRHLGSPVLS